MSSDSTGGNGSGNGARRGSVTSAAFTNLFHRSNSTSAGSAIGREPAAAAARDQRRRLSVTAVGLGATQQSGASAFDFRRGSISTNGSDAIDECAVEDDQSAKNPATPFARRMSFGAQAMRNMRPSPGSPGSNDNGYNWSEQLRSRAESSVLGSRPSHGGSISSSPPRYPAHLDRSKSVSDMPVPPQQATAVRPKQPERPKPDAMQERILKGDFYMD